MWQPGTAPCLQRHDDDHRMMLKVRVILLFIYKYICMHESTARLPSACNCHSQASCQDFPGRHKNPPNTPTFLPSSLPQRSNPMRLDTRSADPREPGTALAHALFSKKTLVEKRRSFAYAYTFTSARQVNRTARSLSRHPVFPPPEMQLNLTSPPVSLWLLEQATQKQNNG